MPMIPNEVFLARLRREREIAMRPSAVVSTAIETAPPVKRFVPLGIFVAWKDGFPARTENLHTESEVLQMAFESLPLEEFGWSRASTVARKIKPNFWSIERDSTPIAGGLHSAGKSQSGEPLQRPSAALGTHSTVTP